MGDDGGMKVDGEYIIEFVEKMKPEFLQEYRVKRIGIFGSIVKRNMTENSALNIGVGVDKPEPSWLIGIKPIFSRVLWSKN